VLLRHFWRRADTCPTSGVGFLTLYIHICTRGMWYGCILETFSQRAISKGASEDSALPAASPYLEAELQQRKWRQLLWFYVMGVTHGVVVEKNRVKHRPVIIFTYCLRKVNFSSHSLSQRIITHVVHVTYPGTWGTCISSLSFETLQKRTKSIIIHHHVARNTKKTLAWIYTE